MGGGGGRAVTSGAAVAGEGRGGGDHLVDAYVSFGDADRRWVEEELVPRLEAAGRSVFREDQLAPGGIEIEERCRALAASRKTLLVLSRAYLEHRWTVFEEAITLEMDPAARKRRLVPILRDAGAVPLRIRPLVSVDLRGEGEPQQWQRLLDALDPADRPAAGAGPLQRLSLRLAVATAELAAPSWHPAGTAWLAAGFLAYCLLLTLACLLWWEMPPLRNSALLLGFLLPAALAVLAWREDRDLFRRVSHLLARWRLARTAVALLLALVMVTWARAGLPQAREILCGPFGCKEPGTVYVTIAGFEAADPASAVARSWADRSLRNLRLKLAGAGDRVRVLASDLPQIGEAELRRLEVDYTLAGHFDDGGGLPVLAATLWDRNHALLSPGVEVTGSVDPRHGSELEVSAEMRRLQDRLAREVLDRLGVELPAGEARRLDGVPTASAAAMARNAEGFARLTEGRLDAAEAAFREALALDDGYSVAWSNLAETMRLAGRHRDALAYRRAAVERLPGYAPFHYNLGHTLATLGRHLDALDALETAVELDPSHAPTRNEIGRMLLALGEVGRARRSLKIGLLIDPGSAPLHKNLARALVRGGELGEAVAAAEAALALYPEADWQGRGEATSLLVVGAARSGDDGTACRHLGEVRRLDPGGLTQWRADAEAALPPGACAVAPGLPRITPRAAGTAPITSLVPPTPTSPAEEPDHA